MNKRWEILPIDEKKQILLEKNLHISSSLAEILTRKNLDENSAKLFLNPTKIPYHDPFLLKDMEKACGRGTCGGDDGNGPDRLRRQGERPRGQRGPDRGVGRAGGDHFLARVL